MVENEMVELAEIVKEHQEAFFYKYKGQILPQQRWALSCIVNCRNSEHSQMMLKCAACNTLEFKPHSCGNRNCPKCQNHENSVWLERQKQKLLPVSYYMITFTMPWQLRKVCYTRQKEMFDMMFNNVEQTLKEFALRPSNLGGDIGFISVLHTNSRRQNYHPHIHVIIPGGAIDRAKGLWKKKKTKFLFNPQHLSEVFRGKMMQELYEKKILLPRTTPKNWVVHSLNVGGGVRALEYLSRYLYRGTLGQKSIVSNRYGIVTFCYKDSNTKKWETRSLPGADFLMLILRHVLPKGYRRSRDYGFMHHNAKLTLQKLQLIFHVKLNKSTERKRSSFDCKHCGGKMKVISHRIRVPFKSKTNNAKDGPPPLKVLAIRN
jgi:hypothetical protein